MKKLNHFLMAGLALVAAVSCSKTETPAEQPEESVGVPMTLTATLGGPETKMTMAEDGNVLKSTWDASEKISVITYTGSGYSTRVQTIDTFTYTCTAGQKSVAELSSKRILSTKIAGNRGRVFPKIRSR